MNKKWSKISQVIAVLLFMWSAYFVLSVFSAVNYAKEQGLHYQLLSKDSIGYFKFIETYHIIFVIAIISLYGGAALLFEKKLGWMAALASCLLFMGFMMVSARNNLVPQAPIVSSQSPAFVTGHGQSDAPVSHTLTGLSYLGAALIFLTMFILLALKPFRQKYQPNFLNWLLIGCVVVAVLIDKAIF